MFPKEGKGKIIEQEKETFLVQWFSLYCTSESTSENPRPPQANLNQNLWAGTQASIKYYLNTKHKHEPALAPVNTKEIHNL